MRYHYTAVKNGNRNDNKSSTIQLEPSFTAIGNVNGAPENDFSVFYKVKHILTI